MGDMADWINERDNYDDDGPERAIHCSICLNFVTEGEHTEQELLDDGWLLEPVVFCPLHGPDEKREANREN